MDAAAALLHPLSSECGLWHILSNVCKVTNIFGRDDLGIVE